MGTSATGNSVVSATVEIDAHVVYQLGAELVTDAEQAILELIKNSYDADAEWVKVLIDTKEKLDPDLNLPQDALGVIRVTDNGHGMTLEDLQRRWMTISVSSKRELKKQQLATGELGRFGRTPLGDKGLGRLSAMKLGSILGIKTYSSPTKNGHQLNLRWSEFSAGRVLSTIKVDVLTIPPSGATGTELTVYGLNNPDHWRGHQRIEGVEREIAKLISPFSKFSKFKVSFAIDGRRFRPELIAASVRDTATTRFEFAWRDGVLSCKALVKLGLFRTDDQQSFDALVGHDRGAAFFDYLENSKKRKKDYLKKAKSPWFIELHQTWTWDEVSIRKDGQAAMADPGPLHGEVDSFELDSTDEKRAGFGKLGEYRKFVKAMAGVRVYRDGFAIRVGEDWLGLGKSWTSGRSYYGLKPSNTLGYVAISARDNQALVEKSDREGFIENEASRGLEAITQRFVKFANDALNDLRRSYSKFRSLNKATKAELKEDWSSPDAAVALRRVVEAASVRRKELGKVERSRLEAVRRLESELESMLRNDHLRPGLRSQVAAARKEFKHASEAWERSATHLSVAASDLEQEGRLADAVLDRMEQLQTQASDLYDFVAIGLVAQALAHDARSLLDDLVGRTQAIRKVVRATGEPELEGFLEAVKGTAAVLRKQLGFLDPMLRGTREIKQEIPVANFVAELFDLRRDRFARFNIRPEIRITQDFTIKFNRGRLLQVLDNLFRNSEFWLRRKGEKQSGATLRLTVVVDAPYILVSDTGPGINPSVEDSMFEPFITDKPRGLGNGLGLFITAQLLEREGCSIALESGRNADGRRFKFRIDLREVALES